MEKVNVKVEGLATVMASRASTFAERLAGLRWPNCGEALLIESSSVHTLGLYPIVVVAIGGDSKVVAARRLAKNRVAWIPGAKHILELPAGVVLPAPGSKVEVGFG